MGKIFSAQEIEQGRLPSLDAFSLVIGKLDDRLKANRAVSCAVLGGSVITRSQSIRSDIDVLVIYETGQETDARRLFRELYAFAGMHHVQLEILPICTAIASTSMHNITPGFLNHFFLSIQGGGVIKGDLLDSLGQIHTTADQDARTYLARKNFKFERWCGTGLSSDMPEYLRILHEILDTPIHIARRLLDLLDQEQQGWGLGPKGIIVERYQEKVGNRPAVLLAELRRMELAYLGELSLQLEQVDLKSYGQMLKLIGDLLPLAADFIRSTVLLADKI